MPLSVIEALLEKTLVGNYDDDLPWDAVNELRAIGTKEVFDKAASWCECPQPLVRARGLDILAQIGCTPETHEHAFPDEALKTISNLLDIEAEEQPISSAIYALGHIRNPISLSWIVEKAAHPSCDVRHAVAFALGSFPDDPKVSKHLSV